MPKSKKAKSKILTLHVVDAPSHVEWTHIRDTLAPYGKYLDCVISKVNGLHKTWRFALVTANGTTGESQGTSDRLENMLCRLMLMLHMIPSGDMMQAAVDGTTIATPAPPWILRLQCRPFDLNSTTPTNVLPLFIPRMAGMSLVPTRVQRYHELRPYGRLASVEVNVDVGFHEWGDVVYFCNDTAARATMKDLQKANNDLKPKIFDPTHVYCSV
jgi:hypothetical protein